jgi:hypothetical protein
MRVKLKIKFKETLMIHKIKKFAKQRQIDEIKPNDDDYAVNIVEELLEHRGYSVPKEQRKTVKVEFNSFIQKLEDNNIIKNENVQKEHYKIDAMADIVVFSLTEMMKHKYNPSIVMREVAKEISSRTGKIEDGKFQKILTGTEYTANLQKAVQYDN